MSGTKNQPKGGKGGGKTAAPRGGSGAPVGKDAQRAARRVEIVGVDNPVTSAAETPRMQKRYREEIRAKLRTEFNYANEMQIPKLEKIVLNMGVGEATGDQKKLDAAVAELAAIAGQRPVKTVAKKAIAGFKIRDGVPIGCMVTLRGVRMYEFLDRFVTIALPRVRDFRGISSRAFDGRGNYNIGVKEQIIFPELEYDKIDALRGLNISITTSAKTDEECRALLTSFKFPFKT